MTSAQGRILCIHTEERKRMQGKAQYEPTRQAPYTKSLSSLYAALLHSLSFEILIIS